MKNKGCIGMVIALVLLIAVVVSGCNSNGNNATPAKVSLAGSVSAPGGGIAFHQPSGIKAFFARFFAADAIAASSGISSVGSGVTINLIEIDNTGAQVGDVIATTTTDASGNYLLEAPAGFIPASNYVIQAVGSISTLQSIVSGTTVNVDPYTHTTALLVTGSIAAGAGATMTQVTAADVAAVLQTTVDISANIPVASLTLSQLVAALQTEVQNSEDASAIIASLASPVGIDGIVVDSNGAPVANIEIRVRTLAESVNQAITRTDAAGTYTVRVPAGEYQLVAVNDTTTSTVASVWWTSGGGTTSQYNAEKVTVADAMITKDFTLVPGGRISGTVTAEADGSALNGVSIVLRDFMSGIGLMVMKTRGNGNYSFNVAPGTYYIVARNETIQPYATEYFSSANNGAPNRFTAQKLAIAANAIVTADMSLLAGSKIEGTVIDPLNGDVPVPGFVVRFSGPSGEALRTSLDGSYRIWLRPDAGLYTVWARGQCAKGINLSSVGTSTTITFNAPVEKITGKLVDSNGDPTGEVNISLWDASGTASTGTYLGNELSKGDGSIEIYTNPSTTVAIAFTVANGKPVGSSIYLNKTRFYDLIGSTSLIRAPISLGTVTLPLGGVLTGIVSRSSDSMPVAGARILVRNGGKDYNGGYNAFVSASTNVDGSYTVSLPRDVPFARICVVAAGFGDNKCTGLTPPGDGTWTALDDITLIDPITIQDFTL